VYTAGSSTPSRAARDPAVDHVLGNSVGANGWSREPLLNRSGVVGAGLGFVLAPADNLFYSRESRALTAVSGRDLGVKIVTWLILPVVICLSQRLSHACLSISNLYCETANGSGRFSGPSSSASRRSCNTTKVWRLSRFAPDRSAAGG
jgi:hypothetical protein